MNDHNHTAKNLMDLAASGASGFVVFSHWAEVATPILTFLIAVATLLWWCIRFTEWLRTGKTGKGGE